MSRWFEWLNTIMIATLAIHLSTGQGKVTAIILIIEAIPLLIESIRRLTRISRRRQE